MVRIYGLGWVGKGMLEVFPDALVTDPGLNRNDQGEADVAFVCVPTPNLISGALDTRVVEEVVRQAPEPLIIVRSTVNPGTCDLLAGIGKQIVFMPEYLGETVAHPLFHEGDRKFLIMGGAPEARRKAIELFQGVYNANITIRQMTLREAEIVKLSENRAIAFKVAQCQELYDACEADGTDYYTIRDAVYGDDPRFNLYWTFIYPDKRGFNSKCIPKDIYAWRAWAKDSELTDALLNYNDRLINEDS